MTSEDCQDGVPGALYRRYLELAQERPNSDALVYDREPYRGCRRTWADLMQRSEDIARTFLERSNVGEALRRSREGQTIRCAVLLKDHPDTISLLLALWKFNASLILLDPELGAARRMSVLAHSRASHVVTIDTESEISAVHPPLDRFGASAAFTPWSL